MTIQSNSSEIVQVGKLYGRDQQFKPKPQETISAKNAWGVTSPEEKKWIGQQLKRPGTEDLNKVGEQLKTLSRLHRDKVELAKRIAQQRSHMRELQNKLIAANIRIQQMERRIEQLELERLHYYKQSRRFKESGLPALPPASPCE